MERKEEKHSHPSYGLVSFSRRSGNPGRLFGSPLSNHESYVTLSVRKAEFIRDGFHDRFFGSIRGDLFEVDMSAAQFAELLTTMNVSMGVPCTIAYVDGERVPRPPELKQEVEKVHTTFKDGISDLVKSTKSRAKEIRKILSEKKSLVKDDREQIGKLLDTIAMELESNLPFVLSLFQEATEKVVTHAKAEIDAFVTTNVVAAGLKSILEASKEPQAPQLPSADKPEE